MEKKEYLNLSKIEWLNFCEALFEQFPRLKDLQNYDITDSDIANILRCNHCGRFFYDLGNHDDKDGYIKCEICLDNEIN